MKKNVCVHISAQCESLFYALANFSPLLSDYV